MHGDSKLVYVLLGLVWLYLALGEQCPGSVTSIADGSCDEENNNEDCNYDGGDCCQCTCSTIISNPFFPFLCGYQGFECRDPTSPSMFNECEGAPGVPLPCPTDITVELEVWNTPSAKIMAETVNCSGGTFAVTWRGYVEVDEGIYISNGTVVNITASEPEATMDGRGSTRLFTVEGATLFLNKMVVTNGYAETGGAIAAAESTLYLDQTSFISNTAFGDGGAIYAVSQTNVIFSGPTVFFSNSAGSRGGALHVENGSNVSWPRNAPYAGTAAYWTEGNIDTNGNCASHRETETVFCDNRGRNGGAVYVAETSIVSWDTSMTFYDNKANASGGAMFVLSGSEVSWFANTSFTENKAHIDGGAIFMTHGYGQRGPPLLLVNGNTTFLENHCEGSGGGLAVVTESTVRLEAVDVLFKGNSAEDAGGAVFISGLSIGPHFRAARFLLNRANDGGAVSVVSSGTAVRGDESYHRLSSSTTFNQCLFEGNMATSDGGAIHTWRGSCVIRSTDFAGNGAARGGAIYLASMGFLLDCNFIENSSDEEGGYAVYATQGFSGDYMISLISFFSNVPSCPPGKYLEYDNNRTSRGHRNRAQLSITNDTECAGCGLCHNCSYFGGGSCIDQPEHTRHSDAGNLTMEDLHVDPGYWRPDKLSPNVLECYNPEACLGGRTGAPGYCLRGYQGELCSICQEGFAGTSDFECIQCSSSSTWTVIGLVGGLLVIALIILTYYMISGKETSPNPDGRIPDTTTTWKRPLQSLKIVIVAWQVLTQFANAADVVYPGLYGALMKGIEFFNFEFSWILAAGCVDLGFGERLMMFTLGPVAFGGFLATTYFVGMRRHRGSESAMTIIRRDHLSVAIWSTFLLYSPISSVLFTTFVEDEFSSDTCFLRADRRIHCSSSQHAMLRVFAIPMIVLYTLGIPVMYAALLFRNRKVLTDETARENDLLAKSTSTLWRLYRPDCYYFELIECLRRLFFAAILTFITPGSVSQVSTGLMVGLFFMMVSEVLAPYASMLDAWVSRGGHVTVCTSMIWGILLKFEILYDNVGEDSESFYSTILVICHIFMVAAVVFETAIVTYQLMKNKEAEESSKPIRRWKIASHSANLRVLGNSP